MKTGDGESSAGAGARLSQPQSVLVVGGGLAGCCAALALSRHFTVTLVDDRRSGSASAVGAGLVNPLLGRQAKRVWRSREALAALDALIAEVDAEHAYSRSPIVRPALDAKQVEKYRVAAAEAPDLAHWLEPGACATLYPAVSAQLGALLVEGGAIRIEDLLDQIIRVLQSRSVMVLPEHRLYGWVAHGGEIVARVLRGGTVTVLSADWLLLCTGSAGVSQPELVGMNLHAVKGQIVETDLPESARGLPHLSGDGYAVILDDRMILGSTWEHNFDTLEPTGEAAEEILAKAALLSPILTNLTIREIRTGVRVTVPRSYLPMVGPIPNQPTGQGVWYFGGLGSKGLLMAPLIASELPDYMTGVRAIPPELAVH